MNWYYAVEGRSQGPLTESSLKRLAREGVIVPETLVWHPGLESWDSLAKLRPEIVDQMGKGAQAGPPGAKTGSVPLPLPTGRKGAEAGVLKRLLGWGKKS